MRQVCEDLEAERQVLDAVIDDAEIKIAGAGDQAEQAIGEIEQAEIAIAAQSAEARCRLSS